MSKKKPKKQYFLVEVTLRPDYYACSWSNHKEDIIAALEHDEIKSVKVRRYDPKPIEKLESALLRAKRIADL